MSGKRALIVIDMQNDYLWNERKPMFNYNTKSLVENVNSTINRHKQEGTDIIYIAQVFPNIVTNRMFIGFSIKNTEGAKLFGGLDIVSELYFEKNLSSCYTAKKFKEHMSDKNYSEIYLCGLDLCGCVGATAESAVKTGAKVFVEYESTGTRFDSQKVVKRREKLEKMGVKFI